MNYKINIRPKDCRFVVNEEKRKVVCIIPNTEFALINFLFNYIGYGQHESLHLSPQYVGIATCVPEDEWDENLGRQIAFHKAKVKFDTAFFKKANAYINELDNKLNDMVTYLNEYGHKASNHADKRYAKYNDILDEKNKEGH